MNNNTNQTIKYKRNFLSNVIIKIDYPTITRFSDSRPDDIINPLKQKYSFHQTRQVVGQINIKTGARIETSIPVWSFQSQDSTINIELTQNALIFNCTKYISFETLQKYVIEVTSLLDKDISLISRLGLRYINQIDLDEANPTEWKQYINDSLIAPIEDWCACSKNKLTRMMSQIVINEDDFSLNFNYGIYNPIFPNIVLQKQYILDYDCYGKNIEFKDLSLFLDKYNARISLAFEQSIKDSLREKMEKIYE